MNGMMIWTNKMNTARYELMSKVNLQNRPIVAFDPNKKEHRKIFFDAMKYRTWGRSPIRFWLEEDNYNLIDQIQKKLARFYMAREFGSFETKDTSLREGEIRTRPNPHFIKV